MARVKRVIWTLEVTKDLKEIFNFYSGKSFTTASRLIESIIDEVESLKFSEQHQSDEFNPNYKKIIVGHHKLIYRIISNEIIVLRAFDTRSDPNKQIHDS